MIQNARSIMVFEPRGQDRTASSRLRRSGDPATVAKATAYPDKMADLRYVRQHTDGRHEDAHNGLRVALVSRGVIPAKGYANESRKPSSDSRDDGPPRPKP